MNLFSALLATLLLLVYTQSLVYSDVPALRPINVLEKQEVNTLSELVLKLNQLPTPSIDESICYDKLLLGIFCKCGFQPKKICNGYDENGNALCRDYTTCHIRSIYLSAQQLNGKIPSSIQHLTHLENFVLYRNNLTGSIPNELGGLSSLIVLNLGANRLSGKIPKDLGNAISLRHLILVSNQLEGELPRQLGQLVKLKTLDVMGNRFSGSIPEYIWRWNKLSKFKLLGNNFEGPIPKQISSLTGLVTLMISDLNHNNIGFPFPNLSRLISLRTLTLRNCSIEGQIGKYIGTLSSLRNIDLGFNRLSGELPENMNQLQLDFICLTENQFSGPIPSWGAEMKNADFSHNEFSEVKFNYNQSMSSYLNLYACCNPENEKLTFEWEKKTFTCPAETKPKNTQLFINSGGNETLVDGINYEADLMKEGASTIYVRQNDTWAFSSTGNFLGSGGAAREYLQKTSCLDIDDAPLYTTARISPMSLKYYGFCLKNDEYTVKLYFSEIVFTGQYDYSINARRVFDVFIQGNLVLKDFDITKAAKGSIYIPPGLYGPLVSAISVTPVLRPPKKLLLTARQIVAVAGSIFFIMVLILAILHRMGWLGKNLSNSGSMSHGGSFNFQQLKDATQNFHSDNKIGEGGVGRVYKGVLPNGEVIAVKQLFSNSKEEKEEFLREVGTVFALNHPNLVKLLGCSTENNQLLLVYEYMENKSLSSALFGSGNLNFKSRLNWKTRLEICLGIAKGLAFLHEESNLKIIHRDIKPTNVLLDKDLNAKISDFGLAIHHEEEHAHVTKKGGTSCYVAPEYARHGHLTYKADVYSFGVVMLEILSGIASTDYRQSDETVDLLDQAYDLHNQDKLVELMDPDLNKLYKVSEAKRALNLAMRCIHPSPTFRPKMSEVVSVLKGKTELTNVPSVAPDFDVGVRKASAIAEPSLSTHSGSPCRDGTSNPFSSGTSREGNFDTPMPTPLHGISDENSNTAKNKVE